MSLSSWLRDYLYIPLGGNRQGPWRTRVNLLVTMLLGGLWHGANWTFVAWGAYHGVLLIVNRAVGPWWSRAPLLVRHATTFGLVTIGWVLFRSDNLTMARDWLGKMAGIATGPMAAPEALILWVIGALLIVNTMPETWHLRAGTAPRWAVLYAIAFVLAYLFMNERRTVFLYYQF